MTSLADFICSNMQKIKSTMNILSFIIINSLYSQSSDSIIQWPQNYNPTEASFFVSNQIEIEATPQAVWNILINANEWESWYVGAKNVSILDTNQHVLDSNSIFNWNTMGLQFQSTIKEYRKYKLMAWESKKSQIQGYHVWLIIPTNKGCIVLTQESQRGWLTFFEKIFQPKKLSKLHDKWLQGLKEKAEQPKVIN